MDRHVYLDWAATAPACPVAWAAFADAARGWANPSSPHADGRRARAMLEDARASVAAALGVAAQSVVFTGGGTEALGLALRGAPTGPRFVSAVEHDAVTAHAAGAQVLPVDRDGIVALDALDAALAGAARTGGAPVLVAVMHANNETGVVQPVAQVAAIVARHGGRLLVDAVQSAGKLALPDADYVALSGHKLGAPAGIGALVVRPGAPLDPVQRGGGQERGLRAGTENVAGAVALAAALAARGSDPGWLARIAALRDRLEAGAVALGAEAVGARVERLPTIGCLALPGVTASAQLMALDMAGVSVGAGAACSSGALRPSRVLLAMGRGDVAGTAIRVSLGWTTTAADIDLFLAAYAPLAARARTRLAA